MKKKISQGRESEGVRRERRNEKRRDPAGSSYRVDVESEEAKGVASVYTWDQKHGCGDNPAACYIAMCSTHGSAGGSGVDVRAFKSDPPT